MRHRVLSVFVAIAVSLLCVNVVRGQQSASEPSGLSLSLEFPPVLVLVGESITPTCEITNNEPERVEVCVLAGAAWSFHPMVGETIAILKTSSHNICKLEFALDPGEKHSWPMPVTVPDVSSGTLELKLTILHGPRSSAGLYPPKFIALASKPIPIRIVATQ